MSSSPTFKPSSLDSIGQIIERKDQTLERLRCEEHLLRGKLVSELRMLAYEAGQVGFRTETRQLNGDAALDSRFDQVRQAKAALDLKIRHIARVQEFTAALRREYDERFAREAFGPRLQVSAGR